MTLREQIQQVVQEIAQELQADERVKAVIWFGKSYWGTDEQVEQTKDIDIVVVIKDREKMKKKEIDELLSEETKQNILNTGKKLDVAILYKWHIKKIADIGIFGMLWDGCEVVYDRDGDIGELISKMSQLVKSMPIHIVTAGIKPNNKPLIIPVYD